MEYRIKGVNQIQVNAKTNLIPADESDPVSTLLWNVDEVVQLRIVNGNRHLVTNGLHQIHGLRGEISYLAMKHKDGADYILAYYQRRRDDASMA